MKKIIQKTRKCVKQASTTLAVGVMGFFLFDLIKAVIEIIVNWGEAIA